MEKTAGIPVYACEDRKKPNLKYPKPRPFPDHAKAKQVREDLKDWGNAWGHWIGLLADEIGDFLEGVPPHDYEVAVGHLIDWGQAQKDLTCNFIDTLRGGQAGVKGGSVIGESTQPPPPPFGKPPRQE
jgi:hypothetical protein